MMPQLAKILSQRHGFTCDELFSMNPKEDTIDPHARRNIPGLEALGSADLLILFTRWRDLPDEEMKYLVDYIESGRPIIVSGRQRTFELKTSKTYQRYSWNNKYRVGKAGLAAVYWVKTWIDHQGNHGKESTRGILVRSEADSPILRGIQNGEIWVPTDVYEVRPSRYLLRAAH
jgi:hypothetical protein